MAEILKLKGISISDLERVNAALRRGALVCLPTDTVYGLSGMATVPGVPRSIYGTKGRQPDKPLSLAFKSVMQIFDVFPRLPDGLRQIMVKLLPGSVTAVLPLIEGDAAAVGFPCSTSIGVRVIPPPLDKLFRHIEGPLLLSSANISGEPDPRLAEQISPVIREACEFIVEAPGELPGIPSTVVDLRQAAAGHEPVIIRQGAMPEAEVIKRCQSCGCF